MNKTLGKLSSLGAMASILLFGITLAIGRLYLPSMFMICMVFCLLPMFCAFNSLYNNRSKTASMISVTLITVALSILSMVAITQFSTVRIREAIIVSEHKEILNSVLSVNENDTLFSFYMMLGFVFISLAGLFLAMTIRKSSSANKMLRNLLYIQTIFIPYFTIMMIISADVFIMKIVYVLWSVTFIPICVLSFYYFYKAESKKMR